MNVYKKHGDDTAQSGLTIADNAGADRIYKISSAAQIAITHAINR